MNSYFQIGKRLFFQIVEEKFLLVLQELKSITDKPVYHDGVLSLEEHLISIEEYIYAGEYGLAYETVIILIDEVPNKLSEQSLRNLQQVGEMMGFERGRMGEA